MYSVPLMQESFHSTAPIIGDGLLSADPLSLIPVIGPAGELVYCLPGAASLSGTGISAPLSFDSVQKETIREQRFLPQVNQEKLLMQPQQHNGTFQLHNALANPSGLLQSVDVISNPDRLQANLASQHLNKSIPLQNGQGILAKQTNTTMPSISQANSLLINSSENSGRVNEAMNALPNVVKFSSLTETAIVQDHQAGLERTNENPNEFGPVEKAIYIQALSSARQKKRSSLNGVGDSNSLATQGFTDFKHRSKKHSGGMFGQRFFRGGNPVPFDGQNVALAQSLLAPQNLNAVVGNLVSFEKHPAVTIQSSSPACTTPFKRVVKAPCIRYHPYAFPVEKAASADGTVENGLISSKKDENPTTSNDETCTNNHQLPDVHSVAVPYSGSFAVNKSIVISQSDTHIQSHELNSKELPDLGQEKVPCTSTCAAGSVQPDTGCEIVGHLAEKQEDIETNGPTDKDATEAVEESNEASNGSSDDKDPSKTPEPSSPAAPVREVNLPNPLPSYITKIDKPPSRVLKESLHCTVCDVYVNSDNQMKQHINSLRHKNTLQGIPTPPKPGREEKPKLKADQYRCNVCKVTLNSDIQLSQHLSSLRHKNMLEGKPPKPRWSPYDRTQQSLLHSAAMRLPFKSLPGQQPLLATSQTQPALVNSPVPALNGISTLPRNYLTATGALPGATHLKQASIVLHDGGMLQAREIVYVGAPQMAALQPSPQLATTLPTNALASLVPGQQPVQLQPVVASQPAAVDWLTAGALRLAT